MWETCENYVFDVLGLLLLIALIAFLYNSHFSRCNTNEQSSYLYGYSDYDGPETWKKKFHIRGEQQSPINIPSLCVKMVASDDCPCLTFSTEYNLAPPEMKIVNDGNNVILYGAWPGGKKPMVCGGPLCDQYKFFNIRFRWGPNDEEGSEHMIDKRRYAMELQVTFNKLSCKCSDIAKSTRSCAVLVISYLFELTPTENPYFEPIMHGLQFIKYPCNSYNLRPFPLSLLAPSFTKRYFTYLGSLTYPPCTEGVRWIIQPEPLTISPEQLAKFRELVGCNGQIFSNARPVQNLNNRDVFFYD